MARSSRQILGRGNLDFVQQKQVLVVFGYVHHEALSDIGVARGERVRGPLGVVQIR